MTTGRLVTLACCAAILVLGVEAARRIPTQPSKESGNELQILSSGSLTDMKKPRSGVEPNTGSRTKRWTFPGNVWKKRNLTYSIFKYPSTQPDRHVVDPAIAAAFALWAKYVDLNFTQVSGSEADIVIKFVRGQHVNGRAFTGAGLPLYSAYIHAPAGSGMPGLQIHFNDYDLWTFTRLYDMAVREIGHSLGLGDSNVKESAMYGHRVHHVGAELIADDIAGIQARYGPKTNSTAGKESSVFCTDLRIDTIFTSSDGNMYAFKGEHYWKVTKDWRADGSPQLISSKWMGLLGGIDAAFTFNGKTFFFKGSTYWTYIGDRMAENPRITAKKFPRLPSDIDAAMLSTEDRIYVYFFKGSQYWKYPLNPGPTRVGRSLRIGLKRAGFNVILSAGSGQLPRIENGYVNHRVPGNGLGSGYRRNLTGPMNPVGRFKYPIQTNPVRIVGYPRPITEWRGLPSRLDAAISFSGVTYFFKGPDVYAFDHKTLSVDWKGAQRMSPEFFGCQSGQ